MNKTARQLRREAAISLRGKWFVAIIASFIASLLGGMISSSSPVGFSVQVPAPELGTPGTGTPGTGSPEDVEMMLTILSSLLAVMTIMAIIGIIFTVIYYVIGSAVRVGYASFNINIVDGNKPRLANLFEHFNAWGPSIIANVLTEVFTFLWSLLFVIPGIVASLSYAMVPFILSEDPNLTAMEAIVDSKAMMQGNKWRLFCLNLSFIGWYLLGVVTLGISNIWVIPYHQATLAAFYRDICPKKPEVAAEI
jgi:uncharacterized membrane protein